MLLYLLWDRSCSVLMLVILEVLWSRKGQEMLESTLLKPYLEIRNRVKPMKLQE